MKKVILITGASSDFGKYFIKRNYDKFDIILAHCFRNEESLEEIKKEYGEKIIILKSDFSNQSEVEKMIKKIKDKNLVPNYILHLASEPIEYRRFTTYKMDEFDREYRCSVLSFLRIISEFLPDMSKNKYGKIAVMLSSCTEGIPPKFMSKYVTIKYALLGIIKSISIEYSGKGITVNGISPDMTNTSFLSKIPPIVIEMYKSKKDSKKLLDISQIIPTIEFLLSDDSNGITGQNIVIQ